ncbi:MAG: alkaline phosphatase family protein [Ilumatobacter sp.]|nr:alkaline phosphatase family protein [Ilumatobacter sp.]
MATAPSVPELVLGPLLRYVSDTEATVWVETDSPCTVRVLDATTTTFEVGGHHYALVIIEGLRPASITPYQVHLDDRRVWPPADSRFPPSVVRTSGHDRPVGLLFGSCRAAAPHEEPYILTPDEHEDGLGVDALRAHGRRLIDQPPESWPDALVLIGDQVYADELSPSAARRVERRGDDHQDCPPGVVADFEEYTWLYHESWQHDIERWTLSVLPSIMIFDDHDVIDDWNTSASWVAETRAESWWEDHIIGAMMSYWIYQHLGNLSPSEIRSEGLLARLVEAGDGESVLRHWAFESEGQTPIPGGYRFSFSRRIGDVQIVMVDTRNGRVLTDDTRKMIGDREWSWVVDRCMEPCRHLVIATSLPVFTPGGIHALQQWDEAVCDGAWGPPGRWFGEKVRRAIDTEHWPAFDDSFRNFEQLLIDRATTSDAPATVAVLGGDIHFSYAVAVEARNGDEFDSRVHQIVSSPIRNKLGAPERRAMRFAQSDVGRRVAEFLMRRVGREPSRLRWDLDIDPVFDNHLGLLEFEHDEARLTMERAVLDEHGRERLEQFKALDL